MPEFQQTTLEPTIEAPQSPAVMVLPTWRPRVGQKVTTLQWDEVQVSDGHPNASVIDLTVIYEQCFSYF